MEPQAQAFEDRLVDLEAQIDRLNVSLQQWRHTQDHLQPIEHRLVQLTDQCADMLKQWNATGERHAQAVGELETRLTSWNDVETRLQREASGRFQALERAIEHEWAALRLLHEEPVQQLRTQAESLTEICVSTAGSAQTGLERAEARLATLENDLHRRMDELSRDLQAAVAELRPRGEGSALRAPATPWSLDEVTRLHHGLREGTAREEQGVALAALPAVVESADADGPKAIVAARLASPLFGSSNDEVRAERHVDPAPTRERSGAVGDAASRWEWKWYVAVAVLALSVGLAVVFAMSFYRRADSAAARATEAQQHAEHIANAADERIEAARQDAATRIAQARESASKAQLTSDVLAAPDLIRFNLTGGEPGARVSAQLLLSRSRGMVFSGSRLPAPPAGSTYQIWLVTATRRVSAGTFVPDGSGRVTSATDTLPEVPRPIIDVRVTLEPEPGRPEPSGAIVLARTP